ncbi:MAG: putative polysaccharide biosynthesis protein [Halanaerobiaceae bacterium]
MKKQSFLAGAFILTITGFINRFLGFLLRMLIVRQIGDEGLGLFQMVYPLYITALLLATAGFPVAISKLIPERLAENNIPGVLHYLKVTIITLTLTGITLALTLLFAARFLSTTILNDPRSYYPLLGLLPALIICSLASAFRGFFQGHRTMNPTALSRLTEQICRFLATLVIIHLISSLGIHFQAAGIALGITVGETAGLIILLYMFLHRYGPGLENKIKQQGNSFLQDSKQIAFLALPITAGRIVNSLMQTTEAVLIPRQLELAGYAMEEATSLYGQLSGMVLQIISLPSVITFALATSLIPSISEAHTSGNQKKIKNNFSDILRIATILGIGGAVIFFSRGQEICNLLFNHPQAGRLLSGLALSVPFIYFLQLSSGMLNGLGRPRLSVRNLLLGSLLKLGIIYFFIPHPDFGIFGALLGITAGSMLAAFLNFISTGKIIGFKFNINKVIFRPLIAGTVVYLLNPLFSRINHLAISKKLHTPLILLSLVLIYFLSLLVTGAITRKDLQRFKR